MHPKTFNVGKLQITFSTQLVVFPKMKDGVPRLVTSYCVYEFNCSRGVSYVGHCSRDLIFCAWEHRPVWLNKGGVKMINFSILDHLVRTGHRANIEESYSVIYRLPNKLPKDSRYRILRLK